MKLFVVEDEQFCREDILSMPWSSIDIEVVGDACDGKEALEKIQNLKPDIVISDIKMPKYDGFWLAEKINLLMQDVKIIFLTSYDLFDYAQKAVDLKVNKYILKPIVPGELLKMVEEISKTIFEEQKNRISNEDFQRYMHDSRMFLKEWFFNMISLDNLFGLEKFGFVAHNRKYLTIVISLSNYEDDFNSFNCFQYMNDAVFVKSSVEILSFFEKKQYTYILSFEESYSEKIIVDKAFQFSASINNFMECNNLTGFFIGIGRCVTKYTEIKNSYNGAVEALKYKFTLGENQTVYINEIEPYTEGCELDDTVIRKYVDAVKLASVDKSLSIINSLFDILKENHINIDMARQRAYELCTYLSKAMFDVGQNPMDLFSRRSVWLNIMDCTLLQDLHIFLNELTKNAVEIIEDQRNQKTLKMIETVKKIIHQNYSENLTLNDIASKVFVSACYLSAIFSKEAKMTIKDYITKTRIEEAKKLLEKSEYRIYEIAEMVGYENSTYFSSTFKKETGQMPTQYRLNCIDGLY